MPLGAASSSSAKLSEGLSFRRASARSAAGLGSEMRLALKAPRFRSPGTWGRKSTRAHAEPILFSDLLRPAEGDKIIEQRPLHQRPKIAPHPHVGFQALRGALLETEGMGVVDRHHIVDIGAEHELRLARFGFSAHLDR